MENITVSVMPTYYCSNNCEYCYLRKSEVSYDYDVRPAVLNLSRLNRLLRIISGKYNITTVEMYGGDLSTLDRDYVANARDICLSYCKNIRVTWMDIEGALAIGFKEHEINVSLNPERRDFLEALYRVKQCPRVGVITVATAKLLAQPIDSIFDWYKNFRGNVTIMPYSNFSPNAPVPCVSNYEYCAFMIQFIRYYLVHKDEFKFKLTNILMLQDCINGYYSPAMRNNIFITPNNKLACVDFDYMGHEYFHEFKSLEKWEERCALEDKERLIHCGICENFNCCMAEHFKRPDQVCWFEKGRGDICNGYMPLVEWAKEVLDGFSY